MRSVLIIDHCDSFTQTLAHLIETSLGCKPIIRSYPEGIDGLNNYSHVVLSGGPGHPKEYSMYAALFAVQQAPVILGICLGAQIINYYLGGSVEPLNVGAHGKAESMVFEGKPYIVARYHSLHISAVAPSLQVFMATAEGIPMGISHRQWSVIGYQFHPESFLTTNGAFFIQHAFNRFNIHK